jgi:hypothetical protein
MVATTWATMVLCMDDDLRSIEMNVLQWVSAEGSAAAFREEAKKQIAAELRQSFKSLELRTDASDVLDLLLDVTPLKYPACYLTLHLICINCSTGQDQWDRKAEIYWAKYKEALPGAIGMLSFDVDENATIEDAEKYYLTHGVRMTRGAVD